MTTSESLNMILNFVSISAVVTSTITGILALFIKKQFDKVERKEDEKIEATMVKMRTMQAIGELSYATGIAVRDGKVNGEMTSAIATYQGARAELDEFILRKHAENIAKR